MAAARGVVDLVVCRPGEVAGAGGGPGPGVGVQGVVRGAVCVVGRRAGARVSAVVDGGVRGAAAGAWLAAVARSGGGRRRRVVCLRWALCWVAGARVSHGAVCVSRACGGEAAVTATGVGVRGRLLGDAIAGRLDGGHAGCLQRPRVDGGAAAGSGRRRGGDQCRTLRLVSVLAVPRSLRASKSRTAAFSCPARPALLLGPLSRSAWH